MARLQALLSSRWAPALAAACAIIAMSPCLSGSLHVDDHQLAVALRGTPRLPGPEGNLWEYFNFSDGSPRMVREFTDAGLYPWWSHESLKLRFLRPLTAATHVLDGWWWPRSPNLMHLHSLAWYAAAVALVTVLYRRMQSPWGAGLGGILFAINDHHAVAVGWIANRNTLLATAFGVAALIFHDRWRKSACRWSAVGAPACFLAALLSKECAIITSAYLFAYSLTLESARGWRRFATLVPCAAVGLAWLFTYRWLGYGTHGSGQYADPAGNWLVFLGTIAGRFPLLLLSIWHWLALDVYGFADADAQLRMSLIGGAIVTGASLLFLPLVQRDTLFRFWFLGGMLAVIPLCAAFPSDRVTMFAGVAGMGLAARFVELWLSNSVELRTAIPWIPLRSFLGGGWLAVCSLLAVVMIPVRLDSLNMVNAVEQHVAQAPEFDHMDLTRRRIIFVNAPDPLFVWHFLTIRAYDERPLPKSVRMMVTGRENVTLFRRDDRTLDVVTSENILQQPTASMFRSPRYPLRVGSRFAVTGMTVEILAAASDGSPRKMRFHFDQSLDSSNLVWFAWQTGTLVQIRPPALGATVSLNAPIDSTFGFGAGSVAHRMYGGTEPRPGTRPAVRLEVAEILSDNAGSRSTAGSTRPRRF